MKKPSLKSQVEETIASRVLSELMAELAYPELESKLDLSPQEVKELPRGLPLKTIKKAVNKIIERIAEEAYASASFDSQFKEPSNTIGGDILVAILKRVSKKAIIREVHQCAGQKV